VTLNGGNCTVPVALCIPAAQTNFPVLLSFTDAHLGANAQADGDDILFTSDDGSPTSTGEVGVSPRHTGVFGTGFQLEGRNADTIRIFDNHVRIEGLTILATATSNDNAWGGIWSVPDGPSDVRISDNIIKGNVTGDLGCGLRGEEAAETTVPKGWG
jgi:hypothetical protein